MRIVASLLFVGALLAVTSLSTAQPPQRQPGQPGKGAFPGRGFTKPGEIFSAGLQERLKLSDEQKKQVADLQKEVDDKIAKILNDEQKEQLKAMSERGPGFPGRGDGKGAFPGKGGPGGKGGPPGKGGFPGKGKGAPQKD